MYEDPSGFDPSKCGTGAVETQEDTHSSNGKSGKNSNRQLVNINDWDGDVNDPSVRLYGTYDELRNAGVKDGHHIVQDASAREVPGYKKATLQQFKQMVHQLQLVLSIII